MKQQHAISLDTINYIWNLENKRIKSCSNKLGCLWNPFKKAKTDSLPISEKDIEKRLEAKNLLEIYSCLSEKKIEDTINQFDGKNFSEFKEKLSYIMVEKISPISLEINKLLNDKKYLDKILIEGIEKADKIAYKKISEMKKIIGF